MTRLFRLGGPAVLVAVLALTGCAEESPPEPTPTSESSSSEPSEDPVPEGEVMDLPSASVTLPGDGWTVEEGLLSSILEARQGSVLVFLSDHGVLGDYTPKELARASLEGTSLGKVRVSYDAELGGEPAYELVGGAADGRFEYGAGHQGRAVTLSIVFNGGEGAPEQRAMVEDVLTGFVWN